MDETTAKGRRQAPMVPAEIVGHLRHYARLQPICGYAADLIERLLDERARKHDAQIDELVDCGAIACRALIDAGVAGRDDGRKHVQWVEWLATEYATERALRKPEQEAWALLQEARSNVQADSVFQGLRGEDARYLLRRIDAALARQQEGK